MLLALQLAEIGLQEGRLFCSVEVSCTIEEQARQVIGWTPASRRRTARPGIDEDYASQASRGTQEQVARIEVAVDEMLSLIHISEPTRPY